MRHHSNPEPTGDSFIVECPGCGAESGPYHPRMSYASRSCCCGTTFTIDIKAGEAGEVISSK
jgi:hypothetical protein